MKVFCPTCPLPHNLSSKDRERIISLFIELVEELIGKDEELPLANQLEEEYQLNEGNIDMDTIFSNHIDSLNLRNKLRQELRNKLKEIKV